MKSSFLYDDFFVSANNWIECDDMKSAQCHWSSVQPDFDMKQTHIVMWEELSVDGWYTSLHSINCIRKANVYIVCLCFKINLLVITELFILAAYF